VEVFRLNGSYANGNMTYLELSRTFVKLCRQHIPSSNKEEQDKDFKLLYDCVIKKADSPESFSRLFKYYRTMFSSLEVEFKSVSDAPDPVMISTMHSAKGLEWDYVILPCMCDKYFPNPKINDEVDQEEKREHMNSSLKLMFVAATRTKKTLYITYPSRIRDTNSDARPSRYLKNLIL
jgi:superfamily I DNA/RNA helicase